MPTNNFYNDLPVILSSIVNGVSFSLKKYKLDVFTEAIIQHELMKKYNNRLLVSHLDSFPEDAKDLTKFLLRKETCPSMGFTDTCSMPFPSRKRVTPSAQLLQVIPVTFHSVFSILQIYCFENWWMAL